MFMQNKKRSTAISFGVLKEMENQYGHRLLMFIKVYCA